MMALLPTVPMRMMFAPEIFSPDNTAGVLPVTRATSGLQIARRADDAGPIIRVRNNFSNGLVGANRKAAGTPLRLDILRLAERKAVGCRDQT